MSDDWTDDELGLDDWFDDDPDRPQGAYADTYDEVDWVDVREPMGAGKRILIGLAVIVVLLGLAGAGAFWWVQQQIDPGGEPGAEVEVVIPVGSTTEDIGELLEEHGVIKSAMVWNYWTRLKDVGSFQAGEYVFRENSAFRDAVAVLDGGPRPPELERLTIPEGLTLPEVVARLSDAEKGLERWTAQALQEAIDSPDIRSRFQPPDQASMEGMLFPDTYEVDEDTDERTFVRRLVVELDRNLEALDVETRAAELGISPYQVVIVASLIEEEARVAGDRAKIARVIYNRLDQGIPLGIDATSRYEAEISGRSRNELDFESDSPYNTRRIAGLPPTPIAGAGRAALEAALHPEPGDWLYYVLADEEGNHAFLETAREFQQAKQECIRLELGCG